MLGQTALKRMSLLSRYAGICEKLLYNVNSRRLSTLGAYHSLRYDASHYVKRKNCASHKRYIFMSQGLMAQDSRLKMNKVLSFQDVKEGLSRNSIVLIDVRSPEERLDPGRIPGTYNVPLPEIKDAFLGTDADFLDDYDFKKPPPSSSNVALHCKSGKRASMAAETLRQLGYNDVSVYAGSVDDWVARGGLLLTGGGFPVVDYDGVKKGLSGKGSPAFIDVRTPEERDRPGRMPGTFNVPLSEIWDAFSTISPEQFLAKFGFPRPSLSDPLVLLCRSGKRAVDAADKLTLLDYSALSIYKGSFLDWQRNGGAVIGGVDFEEVRRGLQREAGLLLVDVRQPEERMKCGVIPGSVNIPVSEVKDAFNQSGGKLPKKFGVDKPLKAVEIVTHCQRGKRASQAAEIIATCGFNVKVYKGSFDDWKERGGEIETIG